MILKSQSTPITNPWELGGRMVYTTRIRWTLDPENDQAKIAAGVRDYVYVTCMTTGYWRKHIKFLNKQVF